LSAAEEGYGEVLVMLLADVAQSYIQLRTYQLRIEYARQNVEIQRGSLALAQARFRLGATNELDVVQARAQLEQTESQIPLLEIGARRAANSLCVLFGMPPSAEAQWLQPAPLPQAPREISLGIPADLVRRRPDVRNYERQVNAASAQIGIAEADLYPTLGVNGYIGYFANDITQLFEPRSFTGIVSPTVQWNVLNYGRIANNIKVQDARLQQAALAYEQSVLKAAREVEDALIGYVKSQEQAAKLEKSAADGARSVELVTKQFELGAADFNRVFTAQRFLVEQQDQLAQARGSIALNLIAVYEAIGGGWLNFRDNGLTPSIGPVDAANSPTCEMARRQSQNVSQPTLVR
jgi:NodT family efflux transporter outer membrane factor (OMF) lipoprotein